MDGWMDEWRRADVGVDRRSDCEWVGESGCGLVGVLRVEAAAYLEHNGRHSDADTRNICASALMHARTRSTCTCTCTCNTHMQHSRTRTTHINERTHCHQAHYKYQDLHKSQRHLHSPRIHTP